MSRHRRKEDRSVGNRGCDGSDGVEGSGEGVDAGQRHAAVGHLEPDHPAQRRRHAYRTPGVGAQCPGDDPAADRGSRTAGRAARRGRHVPRIPHGAEPVVLGGEAECVFVEARSPYDDGSCCFEPGDARRRAGGRVGGQARTVGRRDAFLVDQVLDRDGGTGEGARIVTCGDRSVDLGGAAHRVVFQDAREGIEAPLGGGRCGEVFGDDVGGGALTTADRPGDPPQQPRGAHSHVTERSDGKILTHSRPGGSTIAAPSAPVRTKNSAMLPRSQVPSTTPPS